MLHPQRIQAVERLLRAGKMSQRGIAAKLGISRGTVAKIAARLMQTPQTPQNDPSDPAPPLSRCPGCGALVEMPCRACWVRRLQAEGRLPPTDDTPAGPLRLELRSPHYERYLAVRAAALARGELIAGEPDDGDMADAGSDADDSWGLPSADDLERQPDPESDGDDQATWFPGARAWAA